MTLWNKEAIARDLGDLPAGVQEVCAPSGEVSRLPLAESDGRGRCEETRLCGWAWMRLEWYEAEGFHSRHGAEPGFLELSFCLSGRMGWQLRDGSGLYLGPGGLAIRLREAGKKVYGMGEKKTPNPFIVACDKFVYIEVIRSAAQQERAEEAAREEPKEPPKPARRAARKKGAEAAPPPAPEAEPPSRVPKEIITLLADSVEMLADEDGYAPLGEVANLLVRKKRDFDPRNFGFSKLSKLVKALPRFEVDVRQGGQSNMKHFFVRDKERK